MSLDRIILYLGYFFLGISSIGFNSRELNPWTTPKIHLAFIGLGILFFKEILLGKPLNLKILKEISLTSFILISACLLLIFQQRLINYPWGENILFVAVLLSTGLICLFKKEGRKNEFVLMIFLNCIFLIQSAASIIQFIFFENFHFTMMGSSLKWRSLGFIGNPNQLALYLSLYYFRPVKYWWDCKYGKIITFIVSVALLLTFSRGVFLALFISYFFSFLSSLKNKLKWVVAAGTCLLFIIWTIEFYWHKTGFFNTDSIIGRILSYSSFINDYTFNAQSFFIGLGYFELNTPIHNQYLYLFNSIGILGPLFYILILLSFFKINTPLAYMIAFFSMYDLPLLNPAFVFGIILYFIYLPVFSTSKLHSGISNCMNPT
jgi:hypothetical protein